jgi:hypothetical protein
MASMLKLLVRRTAASALAASMAAIAVSAVVPFVASAGDVSHDKMLMAPRTASDHLALAKAYDDRAATWQREAVMHKEMAAAYKKGKPANDPDAMTMERHCMKIAMDAEALAVDAQDAARYHRLRAKELQAK